MHYCDIFRATRSSFNSCYTYFGEIFCQTHFLRHLFSHLFCETYANRRRPSALRAHTVAIEAQKHKTRIKQERLCVSFSCLVLVLLICSNHMRKQNTRFKPCNNIQTRQVLCFTFLFGSGSVDVLCSY